MIGRPAPGIRGPNYLKSRRGASFDEWHRSCTSTGYENRMAIHVMEKTTRRIPMVRWWTKKRLTLIFFQAEDGIRDKLVTGVQTCALPISIPLYANVQARARIAKAQADTRSL